MSWFRRIFDRVREEPSVPWEEAECLEDLPASFLKFEEGQHVLNLSLLEPYIAAKDPIEAYYWWTEAAKFWLLNLVEDHPELRVVESPAFLLVTPYSDTTVNGAICKMEAMRYELLRLYEGVATDHSPGKNVVILFPDEDRYYHYISIFYPDGEFATSGGIQIGSGYPHIATYHVDNVGANFGVMAHEMTHLYLNHLEIPTWLNESLAQTYENSVSPIYKVREELDLKHEIYWTTENIQAFWAGHSFHDPEAQDISYDLAHVMMIKLEAVLKPAKEDLLGFILDASYQDAGEGAAQKHLEISLGDLAASFLGPGDWAPRPYLS